MNNYDIVLVTGPSGAGRTTAIRALEDFGYEAIDNLPMSLLPRLLDGKPMANPVVIGIDPRTRDFTPEGLVTAVDQTRQSYESCLLYIDCSPDVLLHRYSETRRRHPLARDESPRVGIAREMELLDVLRIRADVLIDTTEQSPHELKAELRAWFAQGHSTTMAVSLQSFAYKRGTPRDAEMILDMRFLKNPHWEPSLRAQDGRDPAVGAFIENDPRFFQFLDQFLDFTSLLLPAYKLEGKSYFSIGFGCTGGQHRSVFAAEAAAKALAERKWRVSIRHRELERSGAVRQSHDRG